MGSVFTGDFPRSFVNGVAQFSVHFSRHLADHFRQASLFECTRDVVFAAFILRYIDRAQRYLWGRGIVQSVKNLYHHLGRRFFRIFLSLPFVRPKVDAEIAKIAEKLEHDMIDRSKEFYTELPAKGWSTEKVLQVLDESTEMKHSDWQNGKVSGAVYHGGEELLKIQTEAYGRYSVANQLHPDVFPGVRKMESEVVSMVLKLFNAPETGCGTSSSGGTESLLLTCLAARQKAYWERGVTEPEIIAPITIHAGFDKAAYYFNMKLVHAPLDPVTYKVDLKAVKRLVNRNTVLIAGSAPNFPHGIIDDIEGLSDIALKHNIPLHVDACLGSFIVPFLEEAAIDNAPLFDFRVPGVTSISCDTHKYGFAPKGSSIIMYRDPAMRRYQYFVSADWSGGLYASPTLAGSRPGALMVGCWASLVKMGREGYLNSCIEIVGAARKFKDAVRTIPELFVIGDPIASVVAFSSHKVNIYDVADAMSKKGWHLNALQNPAAIHIACTRLTVAAIDQLISDLKEVVSALVAAGSTEAAPHGTAALYGVAGSIQTVGVADKIAEEFLNNLYRV